MQERKEKAKKRKEKERKTKRERTLHGISSYKNTNPIKLGPYPYDLFNLIICRVSISKYSQTEDST